MCVIAIKYFKDLGFIGSKNRDRNYKPLIKIKHLFKNDIEKLIIWDVKTKWSEGLNEYGICILSSAVSVKDDEKEISQNTLSKIKKKRKFYSPDGIIIRRALEEKTLKNALNKCIELKLTGNTIIFTKDECYLLESCFENKLKDNFIYKVKKIKKSEEIVRTNHGIEIKSGYDKDSENPNERKSYKSSESRFNITTAELKKIEKGKDMLDCISYKKNKNPQLNPLRISKIHNKKTLVTTGQIMIVPSELTLYYRPVWCETELDNYTKLNNIKTKTFFEIISSKDIIEEMTFKNFYNSKKEII